MFENLPSWPVVDFSEFGAVEAKPLAKIQQLTARFLGRNWVAIPHVTHHDEIDVTALEARRRTWNASRPEAKLSPLIPLIAATIDALKAYPVFNTSLSDDGKTLFWKSYFNIGIAVDTPSGLLVPVIRDCDAKSGGKLHAEITAVSGKARTKGLSMAEMSGGCFTISSLGHIGGTAFTPIINAPEVAILGVTRLQKRAAPGVNDAMTWRDMLPLSLSYDHRVINGSDAARFVRHIGQALADYEFAG